MKQSDSPEAYAAAVNGTIVLLLPIVAMCVAWLLMPATGTSVDGTAPARRAMIVVLGMLVLLTSMSPFAAIAAWRTWVHARAFRRGAGTGWQGVLEAAGLGFLAAVLVLAWGIVNRPSEAPAYVAFYGGAASVLGLVLGIVLRTVAVQVIKHNAATTALPEP